MRNGLRIQRAIVGTESRISRGLVLLASATALLMMLHTTAYFIGRFFFSYPIPATLEMVAVYYMVVLVFAGLVPAAQDDAGFIRMTMLVGWLRERRRSQVARATSLITASYAGVLAWAAFEKAVQATRNQEVLDTAYAQFSVWPSRWLTFAGFALVALVALSKALGKNDGSVSIGALADHRRARATRECKDLVKEDS